MNLQKKVEGETDKLTEFSFYLMVVALGGGLLFTIGIVIYSLFF